MIDDAFELYNDMGGTMSRSQYVLAVNAVLVLSMLLLRKGKAVIINDTTFVPSYTERKRGMSPYYLVGFAPTVAVVGSRNVQLLPDVSKQLCDGYANMPLKKVEI